MKQCPSCAATFTAAEWTCRACGFIAPMIEGFPALAPDLCHGGVNFHQGDYAQLAAVERANFWFRARNELIVWAMRRHFPQMSSYLEIGCGTGYVLSGVANAYPQTRITGSEVLSLGLSYAAQRVQRAEFIQMEARSIPYVHEFDVVGAFDVLEHIEEDELVLGQMMRALRPNGGVVLSVPQHPWLWSRTDEDACHVRRYRLGELRQKVQRAGFNVEFETSFVSLLLPAMVASRLLNRGKGADIDSSMTELRLPALLNRAFEKVMDLERRLIRVGVRFTAGGSLILVARKNENAK